MTDETVLTYSTNKGKTRLELDLLPKRRGVQETDLPSGLKVDIIEPIKLRAASNNPAPAAAGEPL